jgi:hypothetical protein
MERCRFGVVFSSTTGLEMAMMGKKVVIGADVYYGRRGFTVDVENAGTYDDHVLQLARQSDEPNLTEQESTDAALFHFVLHYVMQWPYPWHKGGDAAKLPPQEFVRNASVSRYLQTIDALATPQHEFQARLADFFAVDRCGHLPRP